MRIRIGAMTLCLAAALCMISGCGGGSDGAGTSSAGTTTSSAGDSTSSTADGGAKYEQIIKDSDVAAFTLDGPVTTASCPATPPSQGKFECQLKTAKGKTGTATVTLTAGGDGYRISYASD